jgi:hypothetical protein
LSYIVANIQGSPLQPQQVSVTLPSTGSLNNLTAQNSALKLSLLNDVDISGIADGAILQYRASDQKFFTTTNVITTTGNLTLNGGEY